VLAGVSAQPGAAWVTGSAAGDLGCPRGPEAGDRGGLGGCELAAIPGASGAQPPRRLALRFPKAAQKLRDACDDVLAHMAFPRAHWRRLHSTNVLERLNRELGCRFDVVGIFPNTAAVLRLLGAVLAEQHDEWAAARNYFSAASMALLDQQDRQQSGETAAFADIAAD